MLVGKLGVSDSEAAFEIVAVDLAETAVGLCVDSRDEEAGDRVDPAWIAAGGDQSLEPAQVGLCNLAVSAQREDQGHVDRVAASSHLLDRGNAGVGGGDLDQQVRPGDRLMELRCLRDRRLGVGGEGGLDLDRNVAVACLCSLPDRPE